MRRNRRTKVSASRVPKRKWVARPQLEHSSLNVESTNNYYIGSYIDNRGKDIEDYRLIDAMAGYSSNSWAARVSSASFSPVSQFTILLLRTMAL